MKLGFLSDAHGNVEAFRAGLEVLAAEGVDDILFLGDAVGYLPGDGVVDEIRRRNIRAVMGNHEDMLLRRAYTLEQDQIYRLTETARDMRPQNLDVIRGWPSSLMLEAMHGKLLLMHGSPNDPLRGYVYPDTPRDQFRVPVGAVVFVGNTHRPFVSASEQATFVNVGSCGLPRDCGTLGAVAVYDDVARTARIVRYDIASETKQAIARCGPVDSKVVAIFERRGECYGELPNA